MSGRAAKVYTTVPGLVLNISGYGEASNDEGVTVPDEVADQFEAEIRGHRTVDGVEVRFAKKATHFRVEREAAPRPAGKLSAADLKAAQPAEGDKKG